MIAPRATYRLQLNKDFTFADAAALAPYLDTLGISHVYLSPILRARTGSTHGYDTVDHTTINPELGTEADFRALVTALRQRDIGVILDHVPNHMGVGGADNALWLDVLKHGSDSRYAAWFDIDWHPPRPGMDRKLLVPFLGASYAQALAAGDPPDLGRAGLPAHFYPLERQFARSGGSVSVDHLPHGAADDLQMFGRKPEQRIGPSVHAE